MAPNLSGLRGSFRTDRAEYRLGEPIWMTLELRNGADRDAYVFLPRGRADGIGVTVKNGRAGRDYEVGGLEREPEAGLVGEVRLEPGGSVTQRYLLTEWITFKKPGSYVVGCSAEIEAYPRSLREPDPERPVKRVIVSAEIPVTIGPPA